MSSANRNNGQSIDAFSQLRNRNFYFGFFDNWKDFFEINGKDREELARTNDFFKRSFYDKFDVSNIREADSVVGRMIGQSGFTLRTQETQTIEELNSGFFGTYQQQGLLDNVIQAFTDILADIDMGGSFKKSKLIISDRPQGIFDFGLASLGLFAEQEFYSEKLAIESPLEFPKQISGIVPPMFVTKKQLGEFWYESSFSGKEYKCVQQDKGTQEAIKDGYLINEIPNKYKTFRTRQKKSYLLFKKEGGRAKKVDLYIPMGGNSDLEESGMLARALPVIMAARFFESVGIRARVNATRLYYADSFNIQTKNKIREETFQCVAITIKDFGEDIDFTKMAISVADNRTFRWGLWKYLPAYLAKQYGVTNKGYGIAIYTDTVLKIGFPTRKVNLFDETSRRFKNWYEDEIKKGLPLIAMEKPLMIFGGLPNPPSTYDYTGVQDSTYNAIIDEFYRILDTVDLYYNKPKEAFNRVFKRFTEINTKSVAEFKLYIQNVLSKSYSIAVGGSYADPLDEAEKLEDDFDKKIDALNEFLLNIN